MKKISLANFSLEMIFVNLFALLMLMLSTPGNASVIYSQALLGTSTNTSFVTSHPNGSDSDQATFNAFTSSFSGTVSSIAWQGQAQPNLGAYDTTNKFVIKVYQSPNNPDTLNASTKVIASITISGNAGEEYIKNSNGLYNFNVDSTSPAFKSFSITAGTQYWMNIYATDVGIPGSIIPANGWGWANGKNGTGITQDLNKNRSPTWENVADARAFQLSGTVIPSVPEPDIYVLYGTGFIVFKIFGRKRTS
jgi:hypothetical protein